MCVLSAWLCGCSLLNAPDEINPCALHGDRCDELATCVAEGTSYRCECPSGYRDVEGDGTSCRDRDECADGSHRCDPLAHCDNEPGSYACTCPEGYASHDDGRRCEEIDPCRAGTHHCEPASEACEKLPGAKYRCICRAGFERSGGVCQNSDECAAQTHDCVPPATCVDLEGTYRCSCPPGVAMLDARSCEVVDPCEAGRRECGENSRCIADERGSYACECLQGYEGVDGRGCLDVDECLAAPCGERATCVNTEGGYSCRCLAYYTYDPDAQRCVDERLTWATGLAEVSQVSGSLDAHGNLLISGSFRAALELCGELHVARDWDLFVAKYDAARNCQWARTFGDLGPDQLVGATFDPSGNPVLAGIYYGRLDLGGIVADSGGHPAQLIAKLDGETGLGLWARSFAQAYARAAPATDAAGNVLWTGQIREGTALEDPPPLAVANRDAVIVKLDAASGAVLWWNVGTGQGNESGTGIAVDDAGDVAITGVFVDRIEHDGSVLQGERDVPAADGIRLWNGFAAKLDQSGALQWATLIAGNMAPSNANAPKPVSVAAVGDAFVIAGGFRGTLGLAEPVASTGGFDVFVAALEKDTGQPLWQRTYGGAADDYAERVTGDVHGRITLVGAFSSKLDFEDTVLWPERLDVFALRLDAEGALSWAYSFGGPSWDWFAAVSAGPAGNVVISAQVSEEAGSNARVKLGDRELTDLGELGAFVLELQP